MRSVIIAAVLLVAVSASAEPSVVFGVRAAEGYIMLFKDGVSSGPVNTRLDFTGAIPLSPRLALSFWIGTTIPNDAFRPVPRTGIVLVAKLTQNFSFCVGPGYQYNVSYGGKADSHFVGLAIGPSYRVGRVTLGFATGPGWTSRINTWSWLFQPSVGITF